MNKDDFYYLGKIAKPFGSKGQVVAYLDVDEPSQYKKLESVTSTLMVNGFLFD